MNSSRESRNPYRNSYTHAQRDGHGSVKIESKDNFVVRSTSQESPYTNNGTCDETPCSRHDGHRSVKIERKNNFVVRGTSQKASRGKAGAQPVSTNSFPQKDGRCSVKIERKNNFVVRGTSQKASRGKAGAQHVSTNTSPQKDGRCSVKIERKSNFVLSSTSQASPYSKVGAQVKIGTELPLEVPPTDSKRASRLSIKSTVLFDSSPSKIVYRFKVVFNDGGITVDVRADQTIDHLMEVICSEWLNLIRNGDGLIYDHDWMIRGPPLIDPEYFRSPTKDRRRKESRNAEQLREYSRQNLPHDAKIELIEGLKKGERLTVTYDFNHRTEFEIQLQKTYQASSASKFPKIVPSDADNFAKSFHLYNPKFPQSLNSIFPHANRTMFQCGERWVCPYPSSPSNGGFICGEFQRIYDVLYLPSKASSLQEALVLMDSTMETYPEKTGGRSCRIACPVRLTDAKEARYSSYLEDPHDYAGDLIPNQHFKTVLGSPRKIVHRINRLYVEKYPNIMKEMFPLCERNYGTGRWAAYRNGKIVVAEGNDTGGENRGVPKKILLEVSIKVGSLHEFFCACESLFETIEDQEVKHYLERLAI